MKLLSLTNVGPNVGHSHLPAGKSPAAAGGGHRPAGKSPAAANRLLAWALVVLLLFGGVAVAQPPDVAVPDVVEAMERVLVDTIARSERSVVAIARVRREPAAQLRAGGPRAPGQLPAWAVTEPGPTDPGFLPNEYGTGVVVDGRGLILTTYHNLGQPDENDYYVWSDRRPFAARVKAADPWWDLAVLEIDGAHLEEIPLGDADQLRRGQLVVALGNPYGLARDGQPSANWGIIANLERQAPSTGQQPNETLHHYGTLIQTDARLVQGTSGGALVNLRGELVGLTLSLTARPGYDEPAGFAIPVNANFRATLDKLKNGLSADAGFLGIEPAALDVVQRRQGRWGVIVRDVLPGTPAERAGLGVGDVITHVDGRPIHDDWALIRAVSQVPAQSDVELTVQQGTRAPATKKTVQLAKKPVTTRRRPVSEVPEPQWRGLIVDHVTALPRFRETRQLVDRHGCVGVLHVERDSPAWNAGLRPGDLITHVEHQRVATPEEFHAELAARQGRVNVRVTVGINRSELRSVGEE